MADQNTTQGQDNNQVKAEGQVKETKVETQVEEPWKKEIAGLNSANSKLQNQLKTLQDQLEAEKISKLSADEQAKAKIEKANAEYQSVLEQSRAIKIENALLLNGLSKDFASMISGKTDEDISNSVKTLKETIEREASAKAEAERNKLFANGGGKDIKSTSTEGVKLEFTREELQTREGRDLYRKNQSLGAKITN